MSPFLNPTQDVKNALLCIIEAKLQHNCVLFLPSLPASCSCIFSISIGVVTMTWHIPAPQPASISLNTVSPFLITEKRNIMQRNWWTTVFSWDYSIGRIVAYPSLARWWRNKSLAASLIAFSGVTRVKFTAAPEEKKQTVTTEATIKFSFSTCTKHSLPLSLQH